MKKSRKKLIIALVSAALIVAVGIGAFLLREQIYDRFFAPEVELKLLSSPASQTVEKSYSAVFEVRAQGNGLKYSWEYTAENGTTTPIKGNIGDTLTLAVDMSMNGNVYRCTVTDRNGKTVTSDNATLTVSEDHTFGEELITKANSCLDDGEVTYVCTSCGYKKTEVLPATGHTFTESITYTGKRRFLCSVCSYSFETDAKDKTSLDEALARIPDYLDEYYDGTSVKTLQSIQEKLESKVYGVKQYDLLSQKETDSYAEKINAALETISIKKTSGFVLYFATDENGRADMGAASGSSDVYDNLNVGLTENEDYTTDTKKPAYTLTLPNGDGLFSVDGNSVLLLPCADDPTMLRTALYYECAKTIGISEAPSYDIADVYIDGEYIGAYLIRETPYEKSSDTAELSKKLWEAINNQNLNTVDTERFSRFVLLSYIFGLPTSTDITALLYEDDGKISIHIPVVYDTLLPSQNIPDVSESIKKSDVFSSLLNNSDFASLLKPLFEKYSSSLYALCRSADFSTSKTTVETVTEETTTVLFSETEETTTASLPTAEETHCTLCSMKEKYGDAIKRNFSDGKITYSDTFKSIEVKETLDENLSLLASAYEKRLSAADSYVNS